LIRCQKPIDRCKVPFDLAFLDGGLRSSLFQIG
jgi:hypothetical protein